MDRIDLHVEVTPVPFAALHSKRQEEKSAQVRERVIVARNRQIHRFNAIGDSAIGIHCNAQMTAKQLRTLCAISEASSKLLNRAMEKLNLSARAYDRILKVSRTIADLEGAEAIGPQHVAEAIQYRSLDRENWGS